MRLHFLYFANRSKWYGDKGSTFRVALKNSSVCVYTCVQCLLPYHQLQFHKSCRMSFFSDYGISYGPTRSLSLSCCLELPPVCGSIHQPFFFCFLSISVSCMHCLPPSDLVWSVWLPRFCCLSLLSMHFFCPLFMCCASFFTFILTMYITFFFHMAHGEHSLDKLII